METNAMKALVHNSCTDVNVEVWISAIIESAEC